MYYVLRKEEVLQRVNESRTMLDTVRKCKHVWLGHVLRQGLLLHDITEGRLYDMIYFDRNFH